MKFKLLFCIALVTANAFAQTQAKKTTPTLPAHQPTSQLPFADARDMTVMVFWADPPRTTDSQPRAKSEPSGSGAWIGKSGFVATCNHVVANWTGPLKIGIARDLYVTEGTFSLSISGTVTTFVAVLVASDPDTDVAILKVKIPPGDIHPVPLVTGAPMGTLITPQHRVSPRGATLKTDFPEKGETLLLAGFPLPDKTERTLILQTGVATGFLSQTQPGPPPSALRIMLSAVSNPGNSGGPVFGSDGKVVGLLEGNLQSPIRDAQGHQVYSPILKLDANGQPVRDSNAQPQFDIVPLQENSGISVIVPAKFIKDLADKNHINLD